MGFSSGHDREAAIWDAYRARHAPPVRMGFMLQLDAAAAAARGLVPTTDPFWGRETLKFFADGIIGGRTGALSAPYKDVDSTGMLLQAPGELEALVRDAHDAGWRVAIHATGDRAITRVLDAYVAAQRDDTSRRHRIEHCFVPPPGVFAELARANVVTVMQPSFISRMGASILRGLGPRAARAYPGASALEAGSPLAFSSDAPTGLLSPWIGVRAAVDRLTDDGRPVGPNDALGRQDAVEAYLGGGAYAMRQEVFRGRLAPGMAADLAVLDSCPFTCAPDRIAAIRSDLTAMNGVIVHRKGL